jgi:replicative superfamily II helicase
MPPGDASEYSLWLNGTETNVLRSLRFTDSNIHDEWEPTKKLINGYYSNGNIVFANVVYEDEDSHTKQGAILNAFLKPEFDRIPTSKKEIAASLVFKLSGEGGTLFFCDQPRFTITIAEAMLKIIQKKNFVKRFEEYKTKESSYYASVWFGSNYIVTKSINHGIGIHYGDMPEQVRTSVERDFRSGKLCVLLSTNTISQGLNFPIKNLIIYSLNITYNAERKPIYIQKRDFWNLIGRAGRAGK